MKESKTEKELVRFLKSLEGCFTFKIQQKTLRGFSDRFFLWKGLPGFIEVKRENLKPTAEQTKVLMHVQDAGGFARSCNERTIEDVKHEILNLQTCKECGRLKTEQGIEWKRILLDVLRSRSG